MCSRHAAQCLINRGLEDAAEARAFLASGLGDLLPPTDLPDISAPGPSVTTTGPAEATTLAPSVVEGSMPIEWSSVVVPFDADVDPLVDAGSRVYVVARGEGRVWSSEDGSNWVVSSFADEVHGYRTFVAWGDRLVGWEGGGEYSDGSGIFTTTKRVP